MILLGLLSIYKQKSYQGTKTVKKAVEIDLTPKEWEAIQANAISGSRLREVLKHTKSDTVLKYASPKQGVALSSAQINRIKAMGTSGYTNADIAKALGISPATVTKYLKKGG